jgi:hypothetical protein
MGDTKTVKFDSAKSDSAKSDSAKSDSAKSDSAKSDTAKSDTAKSDTAKSDSANHQLVDDLFELEKRLRSLDSAKSDPAKSDAVSVLEKELLKWKSKESVKSFEIMMVECRKYKEQALDLVLWCVAYYGGMHRWVSIDLFMSNLATNDYWDVTPLMLIEARARWPRLLCEGIKEGLLKLRVTHEIVL